MTASRMSHKRTLTVAATIMASCLFLFLFFIVTAAAAASSSSSSSSFGDVGDSASVGQQQQQDDSDLVFDDDYLTSDANANDAATATGNRQKRYAPAALEPGDARPSLNVAATNGGPSSSSGSGGKSKLAAHGLWSHQSKKVRHLQQARASSSSDAAQKKTKNKTMTVPLLETAAAARKRAAVDEEKKEKQQSAKVGVSSFSSPSSSSSKKKKIHQQQQIVKKGANNDKTMEKEKKHKQKMEQMMMLANDDEDMMADASGSGSGPPFEEIPESSGPSTPPSSPPPQVAAGRKVYRCSLLIQEPFSAALENRDSDDFEQLSDRFTAAVDQVYASSSTSISTTVHTFESVPGELSHIRVNFDVDGGGGEDDDDDDDASSSPSAIETTLRQVVRTGQIGSFYVKAESLTMRLVTGSVELPHCELQCRSGDQCVQYQQRCDGAQDCADGTDEEDCPPEIIPPVPIPEVNCRGDIQYSCRGGVKSICDDELCDGKADCPEGDDEEGCPGSQSTTTTTTTTTQPSTTTTTKMTTSTAPPSTTTTTRPYCRGESQLSCDGGDRCVQISAVCDGVVDCLDGTDESDCPTVTPPPTTTEPPPQPPAVRGCREGSEFQCDDGDCVPRSQVCDRIPDCSRGEDELNCPCTREEWQCDFGSCIDRRLRCDGKIDCPTDASDEANCPAACPANQFRCGMSSSSSSAAAAAQSPPSPLCIPQWQVCDSINDCPDASDEYTCDRDCGLRRPDLFDCGNGLCLLASVRCNLVTECPNGADEYNCPPPSPPECRSSEFRCSDGTCIDGRRKCDGYADCRDRADETNCTGCLSDQFRCESSGSCIPKSQKCDGIVDCPDREDEINCLPLIPPPSLLPIPPAATTTTTSSPPYWLPAPPPPVCTQYQFRCRDGTCLDSRRRCDSRPDCPDASDEDNCDCRADQYRCGSGQCIESAQRCDRIVDCPDRSDENNCGIQCQNGEFSCTSGNQCVPYSLVCDGRKDCQDFSDESNCPSSQNDELNLKTYPNDQTILQGREVVFQCRDEGPARVPVRWTRGSGLGLPPSSRDVNGRLEMPNIQPEHTGTYICEAVGYPATTPGARVSVYLKVEPFAEPTTRPSTACGVNEATCMNGECIPKTAVCDGDFDCSDQSDEMRCSLLGCQPNEYQCENKRCVLKNWRCDGDDDCGDNSDEKFCKPSPPGSPCRHDEFQCQSQNQCIPRSFHCDMELDCQDRSDEIGCSKPTILIPPPPMVMVNLATTIVINCTAVGVPTPEVVWRLNWGHVPSKCTMTSELGFGVLTCRDSQIIDQGAYSCEAINAKGSTFAVPDCIVVVKPSADICIDEEFNSAAASPADCLPCFCFGHTMDCSSSSLYVSQLPPPTDQFQLITLRTETIRRFFLSRDLSSSATLNRPYLRSPAQGGGGEGSGGIQVFRRDFSPRGEVAYFNLPPTHRGYQLLSYGGYLKYRLTFRGTGAPVRPTVPDVILRGNGITLYHDSRSSSRLQANQANEMSVRFIPDEWTKGQDGREPAQRQDLMMALQSIEFLLIRASYVESAVLDTTVSQIRMDTASEQNYNQGQAVLIEECRCPPGYIGLSCDSCAPGYTREETSSSSRFLGRCLPATAQPFCDPTYEWTCPGDGSCIDLRRRCDGRPDCRDRSDESNCSPPPPPISPPSCDASYEWTCPSDGSCVDLRRLCDGRSDCRDSSDESNCPPSISPTVCDVNYQWVCDGKCVDISKRCNGLRDCYDFTDELNCPGCDSLLEWRCANSQCISSFEYCDNVANCYDGTDEVYCPAQVCPPATKFQCATDGRCLEKWRRCDGNFDCADRSDEIGCPGCELSAGGGELQFRCADGTCLDRSQRCNGYVECWDRTDEIGCHHGGGGIQQPPVIQQPPQQQGPSAPSIVLTVTDPRIQIAEIGSTVRFRCSGQSLVGRQVLLRWGKEGAPLPPGRAQDDRRGVLIISDVRHSDSGTYVCSGQDGLTVVTETVVLNVGGGQNPSPPLVAVEPRFVEAQLGQSIQVRCTAEGYPQPTIQWLSAREIVVPTSDGILKIASVRKSDEGEYTCMATNPSGSSTGRVTVFVRSGSSQQGPSEVPPVQVVVSPQDTTARRGDVVRLTCRAEIIGDRIAPVIRWTKMDGPMPSSANGQNSANGVLILSNVSPSDTGIYVCTVTASSGAFQQSQARLTVLSYNAPPTVRIEPDRQTISQGTSAELRCLAVGEPSPSIRWTKVGEDFSNNVLVTGPVLRVVNAMVRDRGMYICSAENSGGLAQASAIVEVERREPPAVELYPTTKQTVVQGGSALFQCRVTAGIPTPRAKWSRVDGRPMPSNVEELDGGVIRFNRVTGINEQGQYVCTAENDVGTITGVATLTIQSIPVVSVTPSGSPIKAKVGQRLRLECRAQGDPAPSVSWRRLRTGFLYDAIDASNKETQQVAVYDINRVTQADEGTYSCTARNEAGLTEERLQIIVEPSSNRGDIEENENEIDGSDSGGGRDGSSNTAGGNLMGGDDVFRVPVGGTAEMRCILQGSQQGIYLDWVRSDGGAMPADRDIRDGVLYIRNVKQDAAGVYSCIGISAQGATVFSADRRLEIVAPPRIQLEPQRQVVRPGDQAEIRCVTSGDQPITINWFKIDGTLPPAVLVNNGQIQFRGIAVSDAGRYICSARNSVGQAEAVAEVIVNEDMTVSVGREQTVYIGSTVELSCNLAPGTSAARVQWSRDRGFLPPTAFKKRDHKLQLVNVQPEDAGRYQCEVSTAQGVSSEYVLLKIDRAPSLAVQLTPNRESVRRGDNLEVRCDVTGDPSALVSWRRIGGSLSRNAQVLGNLLKITDVRPENGGVYRCQVLSKAGNVDENYILSIQADSEYPHDMASAVETRTAPVQSVVVMECRTDLRQPVKFTWSRQGGILPKAARVEGSKLTIPEVRAEDAGTYVCTARNADEIVDIPTVLVVTGVVPYFAQAPLSYMQMPTLPDAYMQFDIEISFKPESPDGLILYNGQQAGGSGDFISFGLSNGHPEFRFDVGAGPAIIKADKAIEMGKWHTVKLSRNKKDGTMLVNDGHESGPFTGSVGGRFLGLDLLEPLYLGGVPNFRSIHKLSGFNRGFVGCIGRLVVGTSPSELVRDATNSRGITTCETCALNPCEHGGVCQEAYTEQGYSCICPSGFSGLNCDQIGETCYPGACGAGGRCVNMVGGFECQCPLGTSGSNCEKEMVVYEPAFTAEGSYIAYPSPSKAALRKMRMTMRIKPRQVKDSLLVYCAQTEEGQGDFSSISIKDKRIEFRFDSGSGPAILKSDREIRAGEWVQVTADRSFRDGVLIVNDGAEVRGKSPGSTRGLNLNTKLFVGGWDRQRVRLNPGVNVTSSFDGCLSQFEVQGMEIDLVNSVIDSANVEDCGGASACERKPCHNGGQCTETGSQSSDYVCQCEEGFSGRNCEIEADLCQVIRPCQNGGTCVGTYNAYKCNCPIGFGGTNCERKVDVAEEAFFQGDSYVEVDKSLFPHVSSTAVETITVEFSTLEPNGILFWHGQKAETDGRGQDYVALTVVDGRLEFSYELGSGSVQITTPVRVDDGKRHRAVARRTSRDGSLELDSIIQENGRSPEGIHQMLNTKGNIYIGGLPNADGMTAGRYIHGLKGCIHQLKIQDSGALNFQRAAVSAINVVPCSSEEIKLLMGEDEDDDFEPPAN